MTQNDSHLSAEEIIDRHTDEATDEVDLQKVMEAMWEQINDAPAELQQVNLPELLEMRFHHHEWSILWLANVVMKGFAELGVLPKGVDEEMQNVERALVFDMTRRIFEHVKGRQVVHPRDTELEVVEGLIVPEGDE